MRIGLLSDTHGDAEIAEQAVRLLEAQGAEYLIHCGDVGETDVLDALAGIPSAFVFGNNDFDRAELADYAKQIGVSCLNDFGKLAFNGKRITVTHGDQDYVLTRVLRDDTTDYLFTGHTHQRRDERIGGVRWINPGALYRAKLKTVGLLDLATDVYTSIVVDPTP